MFPFRMKTKKQKIMSDYFSSQPQPLLLKKRDTIRPEKLEDTSWTHITANNLNISYAVVLTKVDCRDIFAKLEAEVEYLTGHLAQVKIFGKSHPIPRQQSAYGDQGVIYRYSGVSMPAKPWTSTLASLRDLVEEKTRVRYNFVLVNRYKDGEDKMGDHKDDEKELDPNVAIASLTLGAERDFIFKHQSRKRLELENVKIVLKDGMLLLMNPPTNRFWYHGLPPRKSCQEPRINLTFRLIK